MFNEKLKELLDLQLDVKLSDDFYVDVINSELSLMYHGEKLVHILYKRSKKIKLSKIEIMHANKIRKFIHKVHPVEKISLDFYKKILKTKDVNLYLSLIEDYEKFAVLRYKTIIDVLENKELIKVIKEILVDELRHFNYEHKNLIFKSKLNGYENLYLYNKYKDQLKIEYEDFRKKMWHTKLYQQMRIT